MIYIYRLFISFIRWTTRWLEQHGHPKKKTKRFLEVFIAVDFLMCRFCPRFGTHFFVTLLMVPSGKLT